MKVLLAGRHELAESVLRGLAGRFDTAYALPRRAGDDRVMGAARLAAALGIETVDDEGEPALASALSASGADVILSCGYNRIIRAEVFEAVAHCANVHFGALPRYRGSLSIPQAILNGEDRIGVTLHQVTAGIDDGPVIAQRFIDDDGTQSCRTLYEDAVRTGAAMALDWLERLAAGDIPPTTPQDEALATYYPPEHPSDFRIVWRQARLQVMRQIRAAHFPPFPSASSTADGVEIGFDWPVEAVDNPEGTTPGTVLRTGDGRLGVAVLNGILVPGMVTADGAHIDFQQAVALHSLEGKRFA